MTSRRTMKGFLMPDRIIKVVNDWGKLQKNVNFKNRLEFWDRLKQKYDWDNDDLDVSEGKVEVAHEEVYPHIPTEIQGVQLESDIRPYDGAVQHAPVPSMSRIAAAARENAGLPPTTMVLENTGVAPRNKTIDLTGKTMATMIRYA